MPNKHRPMLKVVPNDNHPLKSEDRPHMTAEKLRKWLKHPTAGGFPPEGPATWPRDGFTFARIRDGDVKVVEGDVKAAPKPAAPKPPGQQPQATTSQPPKQ
jgi:hypothetical protein